MHDVFSGRGQFQRYEDADHDTVALASMARKDTSFTLSSLWQRDSEQLVTALTCPLHVTIGSKSVLTLSESLNRADRGPGLSAVSGGCDLRMLRC